MKDSSPLIVAGTSRGKDPQVCLLRQLDKVPQPHMLQISTFEGVHQGRSMNKVYAREYTDDDILTNNNSKNYISCPRLTREREGGR
jgi:hypothetical protein